ncbi:MAG: leucine-rich repeat protein [Oscillospiraceae bacterium]|nr:leucine-rich repeat protein [Oscillospiraceae bacterium]
MICIKCGKEIQDGSNFCIQCRATQKNAVTKKKIIIIIAAIVVSIAGVVVGVLSFTGGLGMSGISGLSGTWYYVSERSSYYDYTITLNSDGTCIIYEHGTEPFFATYTYNDDGTYVTSNITTYDFILGAWIIRKDGKDLLISGSGLDNNTRFTKNKVNLNSVQMDDEQTSTLFEVKKIGNGVKITGYNGDYSDGNIIIPDTINGAKVKEIGDYAFVDKSYIDGPPLISITVPDGVTKIGKYAFDGCSNLKSVSLPDGLVRIGDRAFNFCTSLESITIPESVTEIGDCAFGSCISLSSINIPSAVKKINPSTFSYCLNLKQLTLPNGLTEIGSYAFCWCGITELIIPDTVTKIGEGAFSQSGLTSITIPKNVKEIEKYTFRQNDLPFMVRFPRSVGKFPRNEVNMPTIEVNFTGKLSWLCMDAFDKNSTINYKGKLYSVEHLYWVVNGEPFNQPFSSAE